MALIAALLLACGGMLGLCLGLERHYKQLWHRLPSPMLRRGLRGMGWVLLAASFAVSVHVWGWAMGPVAWFGLISLAGLSVAFLLPYSAR
ncbi:DUF3325 domain-containing protein [Pseudomonas proteolytica]|uniref:DUF3325 family protein n=1 Tax=Pseudomonas proteolytica TaxID=219574 RepID=A0AAW5ADC2_9PSED|nr:DUF3325 domain-containing protein [Pseudomonas proteolytica]KAA8700855.1 DUF3325 domain-containing protein [Pseudomonas proteolytica]MCF5060770.1 DUF3325 family protein [Pseudomonas proteolytica]MCF5104803.1 DUF3325 family protein [Pseudomonas proteolytica]NMZ08442.1 DUF3325 domain-containing protein [Pseudomonas proteolytica]TWR78476.1 DUF3325 domain-containing protein [Pseudomonas proteolytica]